MQSIITTMNTSRNKGFRNRHPQSSQSTSIQNPPKSGLNAFNPQSLRTKTETESQLTKEEIEYLIRISLSKGNKPDKILQQLKGDEKQKFRALSERIGLLSNDANKPTLARLSQAYPEVTCALLEQFPAVGPVRLADCIKATGLEDFPNVARHQACSGIIPKSFNFRAEALEIIMLPNMLAQMKTQTPEWHKKKIEDKFVQSFFYMEKTFSSDVFNDNERWEFAKKFGIVTEDCELSEAWKKAATAANLYLKTNFNCFLIINSQNGFDIIHPSEVSDHGNQSVGDRQSQLQASRMRPDQGQNNHVGAPRQGYSRGGIFPKLFGMRGGARGGAPRQLPPLLKSKFNSFRNNLTEELDEDFF